MKKNLLSGITALSLSLSFPMISFAQPPSCQCPTTPTNISYSFAQLQIDLDGTHTHNDIAWDAAPVDDNNDGTTDWFVVVGSTVLNATDSKDAFALRVNLDGSYGTTAPNWYYHRTDFQHKDEEVLSVYVTSGNDKKILLCGSARTTYLDDISHNHFSEDVWVQKLNLDGTENTTWSTDLKGHFYGSYGTSGIANPDKGFDIAEGLDGNYVVVGQGWAKNHDIVDDVQSNGDIWILQLKPTDGTLLQNRIWYSTTNSAGLDHAESVAVNCTTGHYIVSTFCGSCETGGTTNVMLLDFDYSNLHATPVTYQYGTASNDQNSYDLIQSFDNTFGTCNANDGYVSNGIVHQCFSSSHNFYGIKTDKDLAPSTFIDNCTGNNGATRGGKLEDDGYSVIQALEGYLLAGQTFSNALDGDATGEVSCNHYDCNATTKSDFWLAHVNRCTGELDWNESIGTDRDDVCYSIKRLSDDSYVMVGYTTSTTAEADLYIVRFTITKCNAPANTSASHTGLTLDFYWDGAKCNPYHLQYRRNAAAYGNDMYPTASEAHPTVTQCGTYTWRVQTLCSATLISSWTYGPSVTISTGCKLDSGNNAGLISTMLSVYPNPTDGAFEVSLQRSDQINGTVTVEVLDKVGRVISSDKQEIENGVLRYSKSLDLPSGFYFVRAKLQGATYQAKLIIQKN